MMAGGGTGGTDREISGFRWIGDINVTPMADIFLVLLIIFMITTPLLQQGIFVNKARARNAQEALEALAEEATEVTITRDQSVYINNQAVPESQIVEKLSDRVSLAPDFPLFVKADVATPYGKVVEIVNKARDAGAEKIGLLVDRETKEGR